MDCHPSKCVLLNISLKNGSDRTSVSRLTGSGCSTVQCEAILFKYKKFRDV